MPWINETSSEISSERLAELMQATAAEARARICATPKRVLLLPPDITRMHSGAGRMTELLYNEFAGGAEVHVIPTLGQHVPHTPEQNREMFGTIPESQIHAHDWLDCTTIGEIPADYVREVSAGKADWAILVGLNRMLIDEPWDLVINIGHVVPHEVLGFANHNKNYFIGLASKDLICTSHMMAATCGIENNLGNLLSPLRQCFNKAEDELLGELPDLYVQLVLARNADGRLVHTGVHVGDDLETYLAAARQSRDENITVLDEPLGRIVCVMQGDEFFSTWVANKAIYRTRMALADDGELIVLAPGLKRFGEQDSVDAIIRKYGYTGTEQVLEQQRHNEDLQDLAHAAAHLLHGSTEGRFRVTYAPGHMTREEIEGVNYQYGDLAELTERYDVAHRQEGLHRLDDGEEFFFIPTPSAGLWATKDKLYGRESGFGEG
jgi:nickel-dependent lactate racemase